MIIEVLEAIFLFSTALMIAYLIRHYVFTLTVLRKRNEKANSEVVTNTDYEPDVSILVPACDEEKVIGRLLKRMTELTYSHDKLQYRFETARYQ